MATKNLKLTEHQRVELITKMLALVGTPFKDVQAAMRVSATQGPNLVKASAMNDACVVIYRQLKGGGPNEMSGYSVMMELNKAYLVAGYINHILKL